MVFVDPILHLIFNDLSPEEFALTRTLYLWMMPSSIILVLSTWMSGVLNVNGKFNLSSIAVLLYNVAFVGIGVGLTIYFGIESYGIGALVRRTVNGWIFICWFPKNTTLFIETLIQYV